MNQKIDQLHFGIENFKNNITITLDNSVPKYRSIHNYEELQSYDSKGNRPQQTKPLPDIGLPITLKNIFQHVRAGRATASLLKDIYVMPQSERSENIYFDTDSFTINDSIHNVKNFIRHIGKQVSNLRHEFIGSNSSNNSGIEGPQIQDNGYYSKSNGRYVLVGQKGYGKTFFINYLLSCFAKQLDEQNLIWVRIDLTKPINLWSVQDRLHHQTVMIVLEKYIRDNERHNFSFEGLKKFLQNKYQDNNKVSDIIESLEDVSEIPESHFEDIGIRNNTDNRALTKTKVRTSLFKDIQTYCVEAGYGFMYVLDGLDQIVPSTYHAERYQHWLDEACELFYVSKNYCGVFLMSLRNESYDDFIQNNMSISGETLRPHPCVLQLRDVDPIEIYNRRFEKYHLFKEVKIDERVNLTALSEVTLKYIATSLNVEDNESLEHLLGLLSGDVRNVMLAINLCLTSLLRNIVYDYNGGISLSDDKTTQIEIATDNIIKFLDSPSDWGKFCRWKGYEAIECLLNGEQKNIHSPFLYDNDNKIDSINISINPTRGLCGFFPNFFNFSYKIYKSVKGCRCPSLIKIYTLLFLQKENLNNKGRYNATFLDEFIDDVREEFGWPSDLINTALHELEYYGCIKTEKTDNFTKLSETSVGRYCCNTLIYNHNYLTNSVYETYLPERVTEEMDLPSTATSKHDLAAIRIKNAIIFCKYLEECEDFLLKSTVHEHKKITPIITENFFNGLERIIAATTRNEGGTKMNTALFDRFKTYMP